ncbi:GA-like domain-containing protein [Staphylococcus arlettae]|uniref:GA-like domain-containing protein n=1 Tax=Staphylococcus arlettae TaxID=29378 RepID=UPI001EFE4904|nr:YSIRK-type signal peptide-containing protein [Staphylococcus arlettae]
MNNNKKVQKYSIRKYSVGAASILIGTLLFLNPSTAEAQELEPKSNETTTKENEELSQGNDVTNTDEVQEQELPAEVNTSQKTDEPSDVEEISSQEEKTQKLDEVEAQEVTSEENKVQSTDESKNKKEVTRQKSNEQNADEALEQEVNTQVNQIQNLDEATDEGKAPLEEKEVQKSDNEQTQKVNELQNIDELKGKKEVSSQNKATQKSGEKNEQEFTLEVKQQLNNDNSIEEVTQEVKEAQKISEAPNQKVKLNIKSTPLKRSKRQLPELPPSNTDIPVVPLQNRAASHTFSPRSVSSSYQARYFSSMRGFNDITTNSTRRDAIEIIEKHKQHLTEKEREFYLRNIARKLNLPKNEKTWNNLFRNSIDNKLIGRKVAKNQVNDVNKVLESMKNLINNRQGNFYTEISNNNVKKITANDLRYVSTEKRGGKYVVSFDLTKELGSGVKRFETLSLKVNDSLNSKIEKVLVDYIPHKGLAEATKTLNRDKLGYYSFTTEPKNKAGASATFKLVLKSATEIDSAKDQIGVQLISDTNYPNPVHGVNLELKTVNMKPIAQKVNSDIKKIKEQEAKGQVQPPVDNQAKDEATKAVVEAEQAEQAVKDKLTKANEDGVINPNEHKELEAASNQADTKKKEAEAKVNALSENQKGDLPQKLDKLTGIDIPGINDKDSNGVADNIDKAKDEATKAIEEAEQADKVAKEALTKANEDGVINPKEHQELEAASKKAKETKVAAEDKVKALPENQKVDLPQRLDKLTGIDVPNINDKDSNGVADDLDQAKDEATKAVEEAERADKEAKEKLANANKDGVINPNEHQELVAASKQAKETKAAAEAKVNALSESQKGDLPQRLSKLTGIDIPGINDKDSNGVADDLDQAKDEATKAVVEAERADKVAKDKLTKANEDGVINPNEHQELEEASKKAKETKATADAKVKALPENQKGELPQRLEVLTGIDVPNINDQDSNGVVDDLDQANDEAMKAVEEAEKADKVAKEKLAKAVEDGAINPKEHQELTEEANQAETKKKAASEKVNKLPKDKQDNLQERLDKLTGIKVPNVNDQDSNGLADELDGTLADVAMAVEKAKQVDKAAKEALAKAKEDGKISQEEVNKLTELANQAKETKANAEVLVEELPETPKQLREKKAEFNEVLAQLTGITVPTVTDNVIPGQQDNMDQARADATKAVEEAERADKMAKEKLANANKDGVINPKEHQELEDLTQQAETKKKEAVAKVNALPESQKADLPQRLGKLIGIDIPNINDQDNNNLPDELDGTLADVAMAVEKAKQVAKAAKEALAKAKEDGKISQEEVNKLMDLAKLARETKATAKVLVEELPETPKQLKAKKAEFNEELAQLTGIVVPTVTSNVVPGQQDNMNQATVEASQAVEEAEKTDKMAKEKLANANKDGVINPKEHQELEEASKKAKETKATAEAKVNALPEKQKEKMPQRLEALTGINVPGINDKDSNGVADDLDQAKAEAMQAVEEAERADNMAKEKLAKAVEDGAINPKEHQELEEASKKAKETKATAEAKVNVLPESQKGDLPERLDKLTGIDIPNINDQESNGLADELDDTLADVAKAVEAAKQADKAAKEALAKAKEDGEISQEEVNKLTDLAKQAKETKVTAEVLVKELPETPKQLKEKKAAFNEVLAQLTGIDIPNINDQDSNGLADELDDTLADVAKAVEAAKQADKAAKEALAKAKEDGEISQEEVNKLTDLAKLARETKATAEVLVEELPETPKQLKEKKAAFSEVLAQLTGIVVPTVTNNAIPGQDDNMDQEKTDATQAVEEAEKTDKAVKEALIIANEDGKISQKEVEKLTDLAKKAKETKAKAEMKVNALADNQKGNLPQRLDKLTGIDIPSMNDQDSNGVADDVDQAKTEAMQAVEEAEQADKAAKEALAKAKEDGKISQEEVNKLMDLAQQAKATKATAEAKVNALSESQKGDLPQRLEALTGINVPVINDKNSNGVANDLDQATADATQAVEEAEQADKVAKAALAKANEDGVINPKEHQDLIDLAQQAEATKKVASEKVNVLPQDKQVNLQERLDKLTGIKVPNVNSDVLPTAPSEDDKEMKPEVSGEDGNETTPTASSKAGKVMTPEESSKGDKIPVSNASNENSKVMKPEVSGEDSKETIPTILSEDGNEVTSEESGKTNKLTTPTAAIEDVNKVTLEESSKDDKETSSTVTSEVIAPKALSKDGKAMSSENLNNNSNNTINELQKTGNDGINSYIYTGVLALFGSLLLVVRRRKNKSN